MHIRIEGHTLIRAIERGATENDIIETITNGISINAKLGRMAKTKVFKFSEYRNAKFYEQKKLEVYYTIEHNIIITVTVYVFFGKFEP